MPVDPTLLELHPPVAHAWWWWLVCAGLALVGLALAAVGVSRWRVLRRPREVVVDDSLADLRAVALREVTDLWRDEGPPGERARRIGQVARRFVGTAGDGEADFLSADQLRVEALKDPRLQPVAHLAAAVDPVAFGAASEDDVTRLAAQAEEVIRAWR